MAKHLYRHDETDSQSVQGNQEAYKWTKWSNIRYPLRGSSWTLASLEVGLSTHHSKWSKRILGGNKFQIISKHIGKCGINRRSNGNGCMQSQNIDTNECGQHKCNCQVTICLQLPMQNKQMLEYSTRIHFS